MKLRQLGNNQTELRIGKMVILFSYETPVATYDYTIGKYYKTSKKWGKTTSKHINSWLTDHSAEERPQEYFDDFVANGI